MNESLWRDIGPRQPRPQPPRRTPLQITSGDPYVARRPKSSREIIDAQNREKYGACACCGGAFDDVAWGNGHEQRWHVGDDHSGVLTCCTQKCAWTVYKENVEKWDLARYGTCRAPRCQNAVRAGSAHYVEVKEMWRKRLTFYTCSEECGWRLHEWLWNRRS